MQPLSEVNSLADIKAFFTEGTRPLAEKEFVEFWQSLSPEEKLELKQADLKNM